MKSMATVMEHETASYKTWRKCEMAVDERYKTWRGVEGELVLNWCCGQE